MSQETVSSLLNKTTLCERLGISPRTLEYMVSRQEFPPPVRVGKKVYWSDVAVLRWQRQLFLSQENWMPGD